MLDAGIIMVSNRRRPWMKIFYNPLTKRMDISKLGAIVLSISLLGGISLIPALQVRVYGQQQEERIIGLKITSHEQGQEVPIGEITISGTSTDNATSDCAVYADVNDIKPFQKAVATGPGGENDYSTWNFTYTDNYHLITNGTNELTSKLSCVSGPANLTKWNSVIVVGVMNKNGQQQEKEQPILQSCCPSNGYIANAGPDKTVLEGTIITLNGSSNNNNNSSNVGDTANYLWRQTEGPAVILNDNNTAHPTFVAPNYPNDTKYTFALDVSENQDINNNINNNNNQTGSEIDTLEIISKDVNMKTKNPGSLQEADNIEEQSSQDELQDEGTTGNDG
jgi:hypothetical protein